MATSSGTSKKNRKSGCEGGVDEDLEEDVDYAHLVSQGEENHPLVKFTRLKQTKATELAYLYSPDNPKNFGKDMVKQWTMAKNTLEDGIKNLKIATGKFKGKGGKGGKRKLVEKLEGLQSELEVLVMRYEMLISKYTKLKKSNKNAVIPAHQYTISHYDRYLEETLAEWERLKNEHVSYLALKNLRCTIPDYETYEDDISWLNDSEAEELAYGALLKFCFIYCVKHFTAWRREDAILIFNETIFHDDDGMSDIRKMYLMTPIEYYERLESRTDEKELVKSYLDLLKSMLLWYHTMEEEQCIQYARGILLFTEDKVTPCKTKSTLRQHGLGGVLDYILSMVLNSLKQNPAKLLAVLWIFENEFVPFLRSLLTNAIDSLCHIIINFNKLMIKAWWSVANKDEETLKKELSILNSQKFIIMNPSILQLCSKCKRIKPGVNLVFYLDRPHSVHNDSLTDVDFITYPKVFQLLCEKCKFDTAHIKMIPEANNFFEDLIRHEIAEETDHSALLLLNADLTRIEFQCARTSAQKYAESSGFLVGYRRMPTQHRLFRSVALTTQRYASVISYIDKLLLHFPGELECKHAPAWKGRVQCIFHVVPRPWVSVPLLSRSAIMLMLCPSIDQHFSAVTPQVVLNNPGTESTPPEDSDASGVPQLPWMEFPPDTVPFIIPIHAAEVSVEFLRNNCYKLSVEGDGLEEILHETKLEKSSEFDHKNCFLLYWNIDFRLQTLSGVILMQNSAGIWGAFAPSGKSLFWKELTDHVPKVMDYLRNHSGGEFNDLAVDPSTTVPVLLLELTRQEFETREHLVPLPHARREFRRLWQPDTGNKYKRPDRVVEDVDCGGPLPFTTSHIKSCSHNIYWADCVKMYCLTNATHILECLCSGWATVCEDAVKLINLHTRESNPEEVLEYVVPPPEFWTQLPDETLYFLHADDHIREACLNQIRRVKPDLSPEERLLPLFLLELGSVPWDLYKTYIGSWGTGGALAFLFPEDFRKNQGLPYGALIIEYAAFIRKIVVTSVPQRLVLSLYSIYKEELERDGLGHAVQLTVVPELDDHGEISIVDNQLVFRPSYTCEKGPLYKVRDDRMIPALYLENTPRSLEQSSPQPVVWCGQVMTCMLVPPPEETDSYVHTTLLAMQDLLSDLKTLRSVKWRNIWDLGGLRNGAFWAETGHKVYCMRGAITGPGCQIFRSAPPNSQLVLLTVDKKFGEKAVQAKNCQTNRLILQDSSMMKFEFMKWNFYEISQNFLGFFLPPDMSPEKFLSESAEVLANRLLLFKPGDTDTELCLIHSYYPTEQAKRLKLAECVKPQEKQIQAHTRKFCAAQNSVTRKAEKMLKLKRKSATPPAGIDTTTGIASTTGCARIDRLLAASEGLPGEVELWQGGTMPEYFAMDSRYTTRARAIAETISAGQASQSPIQGGAIVSFKHKDKETVEVIPTYMMEALLLATKDSPYYNVKASTLQQAVAAKAKAAEKSAKRKSKKASVKAEENRTETGKKRDKVKAGEESEATCISTTEKNDAKVEDNIDAGASGVSDQHKIPIEKSTKERDHRSVIELVKDKDDEPVDNSEKGESIPEQETGPVDHSFADADADADVAPFEELAVVNPTSDQVQDDSLQGTVEGSSRGSSVEGARKDIEGSQKGPCDKGPVVDVAASHGLKNVKDNSRTSGEKVESKSREELVCWYCNKQEGEKQEGGNSLIQLTPCFGCQKARYCSVECHEKDWSVHGPWCLRKQKKREKTERRRRRALQEID